MTDFPLLVNSSPPPAVRPLNLSYGPDPCMGTATGSLRLRLPSPLKALKPPFFIKLWIWGSENVGRSVFLVVPQLLRSRPPPHYTLHALRAWWASRLSLETVMSLIREVLNGYAQRLRLENSLQLQRAKLTRPDEIKLTIAKTLVAIDVELEDEKLKAKFASINLTVPE